MIFAVLESINFIDFLEVMFVHEFGLMMISTALLTKIYFLCFTINCRYTILTVAALIIRQPKLFLN